MGYTVKVNHPHFPEGTELNVGGLGRVPNGGSVEVDEDMERAFMLQRGRSLDEAFSNDGTVNIDGSSALDKSEVDRIKALFAEPETESNQATEQTQNDQDFGELFSNKEKADEGGEQ